MGTFIFTIVLAMTVFLSIVKIVSSALNEHDWQKATFRLAWLVVGALLLFSLFSFFRVQFLLA